MDEAMLARIEADPRYQNLVRQRSRLGWLLAMIVAGAFFSFIALVAFKKGVLAEPVAGGVMSLGIPVGFGLILLSILLTGLYVWRANDEYDRLTAEIVAGAQA